MLKLDIEERKLVGSGLFALAVAAGALATALAVVALSHMTNSQALCASPMQHCVACYGAVASFAIALLAGCTAVSTFRSGEDAVLLS